MGIYWLTILGSTSYHQHCNCSNTVNLSQLPISSVQGKKTSFVLLTPVLTTSLPSSVPWIPLKLAYNQLDCIVALLSLPQITPNKMITYRRFLISKTALTMRSLNYATTVSRNIFTTAIWATSTIITKSSTMSVSLLLSSSPKSEKYGLTDADIATIRYSPFTTKNASLLLSISPPVFWQILTPTPKR